MGSRGILAQNGAMDRRSFRSEGVSGVCEMHGYLSGWFIGATDFRSHWSGGGADVQVADHTQRQGFFLDKIEPSDLAAGHRFIPPGE